jgi:hypothetical protein
LADGLSLAGILTRWETDRRPEHLRYPLYRDGQIDKLIHGYDFIERYVPLEGDATIGEIALATSLSWIEFRGLPSFRENRPKLTEWYETYSRRLSMLATALSGGTHD